MSESIVNNWPKRDLVRVGKSPIAGSGAFAKRKIERGTRIIEYEGARLPIASLKKRIEPSTYVFRLNEDTVVDGAIEGNEARFINHSCDPNCEVYVFEDRIFFYAKRDIVRGEELTFDYKLGPADPKQRNKVIERDLFACNCGSENCRGTMISESKKSQARRPRRATKKVLSH
jgi:SET domain-containing protein